MLSVCSVPMSKLHEMVTQVVMFCSIALEYISTMCFFCLSTQGNFFQNIGSIILFAVVGTAVSTFIVGGGLIALSKLGVVYELNLVQW